MRATNNQAQCGLVTLLLPAAQLRTSLHSAICKLPFLRMALHNNPSVKLARHYLKWQCQPSEHVVRKQSPQRTRLGQTNRRTIPGTCGSNTESVTLMLARALEKKNPPSPILMLDVAAIGPCRRNLVKVV